MTNPNRDQDRDAVLLAFHKAYERPTAAQIIEWIDRYPQFADDIRAHAAVAREWDASREEQAVEASESLVAAAYSRALNLMFHASEIDAAGQSSFQEITTSRGMTTPQLAQAVGISRFVIADLFSGRMGRPVRNVFIDAVTQVLGMPRAAFDTVLQRALDQPMTGLAKASHAPRAVVRPYDEIIRTCDDMTEQEKKKWLEEA
jgi:hypothetical protein